MSMHFIATLRYLFNEIPNRTEIDWLSVRIGI
jgi:hypothetical protein